MNETINKIISPEAVYKLQADCGRMGTLYGTFIADVEMVDALIKHKVKVYFGEVLGKHSEVSGILSEKDIKFVSDDPQVVRIVKKFGLESGYNPFDYESYDVEDDEYSVYEICKKLLNK